MRQKAPDVRGTESRAPLGAVVTWCINLPEVSPA